MGLNRIKSNKQVKREMNNQLKAEFDEQTDAYSKSILANYKLNTDQKKMIEILTSLGYASTPPVDPKLLIVPTYEKFSEELNLRNKRFQNFLDANKVEKDIESIHFFISKYIFPNLKVKGLQYRSDPLWEDVLTDLGCYLSIKVMEENPHLRWKKNPYTEGSFYILEGFQHPNSKYTYDLIYRMVDSYGNLCVGMTLEELKILFGLVQDYASGVLKLPNTISTDYEINPHTKVTKEEYEKANKILVEKRKEQNRLQELEEQKSTS